MDRRKAILEAALESFSANGEVAIEDVKRRSGASVGSIYHHYGGKDGIAAELYLQVLGEYQSGARAALDRAGSTEDGVKGLVRHHLRWVEENPGGARFLLQGSGARKEAEGDLRELNQGLSAAVANWLEHRPDIRSIPLEIFYAIVIGPAQELSRLWLSERIPSLRKVEKDLADAAWRGVRSD